jgi:hypothetical protein
MENKQTEHIPDGGKMVSSIDWLKSEIGKLHALTTIEISLFQQATKMHKQEMEKAYNKGWHEEWLDDIRKKPKSSEQYYNETFNPQNNG